MRPTTHWRDLVQIAEFKLNSNRHGSYPSPFALVFGFEPTTRYERGVMAGGRGGGSGVDNLSVFSKGQMLNHFHELKERREQFELLCEAAFKENRIRLALDIPVNIKGPLRKGDRVFVLRKEKNKHDSKWSRDAFAILEVHDSIVIIDKGGIPTSVGQQVKRGDPCIEGWIDEHDYFDEESDFNKDFISDTPSPYPGESGSI